MLFNFAQKILINKLLRPNYSYKDPARDPLFETTVNDLSKLCQPIEDFSLYHKTSFKNVNSEIYIKLFYCNYDLPEEFFNEQLHELSMSRRWLLRSPFNFHHIFDFLEDDDDDDYYYNNNDTQIINISFAKKNLKDIKAFAFDYAGFIKNLSIYNNHFIYTNYKLNDYDEDSLKAADSFILNTLLSMSDGSPEKLLSSKNFSFDIEVYNQSDSSHNVAKEVSKLLNNSKAKDGKEFIQNLYENYPWYCALVFIAAKYFEIDNFFEIILNNFKNIPHQITALKTFKPEAFRSPPYLSYGHNMNWVKSIHNLPPDKDLKAWTKKHQALAYLYNTYDVYEKDKAQLTDGSQTLKQLQDIEIDSSTDYSAFILAHLEKTAAEHADDKALVKAKDAILHLYLNDTLKTCDDILGKATSLVDIDALNPFFERRNSFLDLESFSINLKQRIPIKNYLYKTDVVKYNRQGRAYTLASLFKAGEGEKTKKIKVSSRDVSTIQTIIKGQSPVILKPSKDVLYYLEGEEDAFDENEYYSIDHVLNDWVFHLENPSLLEQASDELKVLYELSRIANELVLSNAFIPVRYGTVIDDYGKYVSIVRWSPAVHIPAIADITSKVGSIIKNSYLANYLQDTLVLLNLQAGIEFLSLFMSSVIRRKTLVYSEISPKALPSFISNRDNIYTLFGYSRADDHEYKFIAFPPLMKDDKQNEFNRIFDTLFKPFSLSMPVSKFCPALSISKQDNGSYELEVKLKEADGSNVYNYQELNRGLKYDFIGAAELFHLDDIMENFASTAKLGIDNNSNFKKEIEGSRIIDILSGPARKLESLNIDVILDSTLNKVYTPSPRLELKLDKSWSINDGFLGIMELIDFDWKIAIGDKTITQEEFNTLLEQSKDILSYNDGMLVLDPKALQELKDKINKKRKISRSSLILAALTGRFENQGIILDDNLKQALSEILKQGQLPQPAKLEATLRPYQLRGFNWLLGNIKVGIGSIIADDMGLGKTIQVIATLLEMHEHHEFDNNKALVIVPTSLLFNWSHEIKNFAPSLGFEIVYGDNSLDKALESENPVIITTYGYFNHNSKEFLEQKYRLLIIDEAQAIKNHTTKNARNIKQIRAAAFIAMTGTPVENRLMEYWSIMDCVNQGLFGSASEFKKNYVTPIEKEHDENAIENLKTVVAPFVLRRLKTDKNIISDLPDKIVYNQYCNLSAIQTAMYQKTVDLFLEQLASKLTTLDRQSEILTSIVKLKQLCNSPALIEGTDINLKPENSGKVTNLIAILDDLINEKNKKVIIFTQFKKMGDLLSAYITQSIGFTPDFLHGGVRAAQRREMIESFQSSTGKPILILSLKAGGAGINLTEASVVIHFDLWWNPAVENQATDRAYRIGQDKNVEVIRFICQDTLEEKIDTILSNKQRLSDLTVSENETWLGNMSDAEIENIFNLSNNKAKDKKS